jgi:RNA polymerase sigma-70 factor (ECF subfamily)
MRESEQQLRAWMTQGLGGDVAAHAALLRALVPLLRTYFSRRMREADADVEDLVQETLIAVHERRATYDRERPFTAWLYAVARYRLIDHFRRRRTSVPLGDLEDSLGVDSFEEATAARMDVEVLLSSLPPKQARAIRETHLEGLTSAEAAQGAGLGESDVKISVHRGLKSLVARIRGGR